MVKVITLNRYNKMNYKRIKSSENRIHTFENIKKALTFSAHGEGGNSVGIDGRGKLAYNELFLTNVVTTCSIRQHA